LKITWENFNKNINNIMEQKLIKISKLAKDLNITIRTL
jgi:hypothetical protein